MTERREVRVTDSFFVRLDDQLGSERGPAGEPSATDFIVIDLPAIVEQFAARFDELPEAIEGVPAIRMLIGTSVLTRAYVVQGVETTDGVIQLVGVDIDA